MAADMEEYATFNNSIWDDYDIGHGLYHMQGFRLNKDDALQVKGLRDQRQLLLARLCDLHLHALNSLGW